MFEPDPLNRTYTLCGYTFQIYDVTGFDFKKQIDLPDTNGVYCFTSENGANEPKTTIDKKLHYFAPIHHLYYLGMTRDFAKRFDQHEKGSQLLAIKPLRIGVYICKNGEDEKSIESEILDRYAIDVNSAENKEAKKKGLPSTISED